MRYLLTALVCLSFAGCMATRLPVYSGAEIDQERAILAEQAVAYHQQMNGRLQEVGQRVLAYVPDPPALEFVFDWNDPQVNAFADTPNGQVHVTWGLMNFVHDDNELACILGHEIGHVTQNHYLKDVGKSFLVDVLALVSEAYVQRGSGRYVSRFGKMMVTHFNQAQELEADVVGMHYAAAAGYDPRGMTVYQQRMAIELPSTLAANFFNSHPSSPERSIAAQKVVAELLPANLAAQPMQVVSSSTVPSPTLASVPLSTLRPVLLPSNDPHAWHMLNIISQSDIQLRAAEAEYRAGHIGLTEYRRQKKELLGL